MGGLKALFLRRSTSTGSQKSEQKQQGGKSSSLMAPNTKQHTFKPTRTLGGGFKSVLTHQTGTRRFEDESTCTVPTSSFSVNSSSPSSLSTCSSCLARYNHSSTEPNHNKCNDSKDSNWSNSGSRDFHKHTPLFVKNLPKLKRQGSDGSKKVTPNDLDEIRQLGQIMAKDRQLPGTWYYSNNHILVNKERTKRNIPALTRRIELDEMARKRAETMAAEQRICHGDSQDLLYQLQPCRRFGENVASGSDVRSMHNDMVRNSIADRNNMLDRRYTYFGMGTAKSADGTLYLCQIFKG